jgi:hypothetical protein
MLHTPANNSRLRAVYPQGFALMAPPAHHFVHRFVAWRPWQGLCAAAQVLRAPM